MNPRCVFCFFVLGVFFVFGQIPFLNAYQAPILQNPSNSGSKNQKRISLVVNSVQSKDFSSNAFFLSYDQFLKKKRVGLGAYLFHHSYSKFGFEEVNNLKRNFEGLRDDLGGQYIANSKQFTVGLILSPKYNLGLRDDKGDFKYTFSPSVELKYGFCDRNSIDDIKQTYTKISTVDTFRVFSDSIFATQSKVFTHQIFGVLGFKFTTSNWVFWYSVNIQKELAKENYLFFSSSTLEHTLDANKIVLRNQYNSLSHKISVGYTLKTKNNSKSNLILIAGFEIKEYLGFGAANVSDNHLLSKESKNRLEESNLLNFYLSSYCRINKILLGVNYNRLLDTSVYGVSFGLQNKSYRTIVAFMPNSIINKTKVLELSINYYFK